MNQSFSKIWIAIILAVVGIMAIVGGGFYAWQKSTKPSITLLSPNGGEIWTIGSTYTIRWISQNIPQADKISIHIRRVPPPPLPETGQEFDPIIFIELENTGSVNWTISDMYPVGSYIIEVNSYPSIPIIKVISDENDAPFRIESSSDETADWKIYRNEEYGYEIKYPQDWKIVNVDWTVGTEYVTFLSPLINNKYYFVLNFGARNKGDNTQISYQPDEHWELLKSLMRLGNKVKIGNVDVLTTEIVEKGKVHSILYSNRLGAGRIEISGLEIQADSGFIEGPQHLSASDVASIDLKNLPELKLASQILSTFKFIEE